MTSSAVILDSAAAIAARIADGAKLAVAGDDRGVAMAVTRELVRRGARGLHLVCVPVSGIQADILIGAGCVATIETSGVSLGEYGMAPRFGAAVRSGAVRILDATCPAIHAALQATQKGQPFVPIRGLLETDVLAHRADWQVIDNPFTAGDRVVVIPAIQPDVALFHAPLADREGNVYIGRTRELLNMAHASRATYVTVEAMSPTSLLADDARAAGTIPSLYVSGVARLERGAWPLRFKDEYAEDEAALAAYAAAAKTPAGFAAWLDRWLERSRAAA